MWGSRWALGAFSDVDLMSFLIFRVPFVKILKKFLQTGHVVSLARSAWDEVEPGVADGGFCWCENEETA
jgi:hypothetical protein